MIENSESRKKRKTVTYKGNHIKLSFFFPNKTLQARRNWHNIIKLKGKPATKNTVAGKAIIQNRRRDKEFLRQTEAIHHH